MLYNQENSYGISVTDIAWEQIYLHVTLSGENLEEYDYFIGGWREIMFPLTRNGKELCLNMVDFPGVMLLPTNKYSLFARHRETGVDEALRVTPECGYKLENLDKIYRYAAQNCMYTVSFGIWSGKDIEKKVRRYYDPEFPQDLLPRDEIYLYIHTNYLRKNYRGPKRNVRMETNGIKGFRHGVAVRLSKRIINGIYQLMYKIRKKNGKNVLLMSETRIPIGGNLKALDERIKERGLDREFHMSYSFSKTLQSSRIRLFFDWMRLIWLLAGQDFVFVDDYVPIFQTIKLRKETKLIQLWHAGVGFKSVGYARFGKKGSPHPTDSCHRRYDYAIVGAKGLIPVYEEVFGIPRDRFRAYGLPRLDGYNDPQKKKDFSEAFYQEYPELKNKKIILFAPTFRGAGQKSAYYPMNRVDLDAAYELCGEEYAFVFKMHPFITHLPEIPEEYQDRIYDMSVGTDINELFYVTDILVTDFSSNIYEFALQNRPMLFYAYDKDFYQLTRGVHRRLEEFAPGKICVTFEELMDAIRNKDFEEEKRARFIEESFDPQEGYASDRIIDEILLGSNRNC